MGSGNTTDEGSTSESVSDTGTASHTGTHSSTDSASETETVPAEEPLGVVDPAIRVDHMGWRPADQKLAVVLASASENIELRRYGDNAVVATYTTTGPVVDEDSSDALFLADLSGFETEGHYYLYRPSKDGRSYTFRIATSVYNLVGVVALKSFYYQRCNHDKVLPFASDAVGVATGLGGKWVDDACHTSDAAVGPGPDSADHGPLDLHGGWHDAGDYQKTLWGRGVTQMLWAFELNKDAWSDGQASLPESGNGVPDILDELAWELDFYLRMQRPDGHFMTSVKGHNATVTSPPSASNEERVYFDTTSPSGSEWSGGGVTITEATGNAVHALAHAAIVWDLAGQASTSDTYREAALNGWQWLASQTAGDDTERRLKAAAAAAVYRLDNSETSARDTVEAFSWSTWDGRLPGAATPNDEVISSAAWHALSNSATAEPLDATIREAVRQAIVDRAFSQAGVYGGMFGGPGNGWDWSWGSNRAQGLYGSNLLIAERFGITAGHSSKEIRDQAARYLHYLLGLNPLNMLYLTNMAAYGGEHSSFQMYHGWFSYDGGDGDHGNATYNGKPASLVEPLYPYHPQETQTSIYGPAPGLVPGGPNYYYSGQYDIPNRENPAYAYRDWSVGCDWDGATCRSASWEISEPMAAYQGPFILLISFFMSPS